jgi:peptide/nickel transport system substrate-binding protein
MHSELTMKTRSGLVALAAGALALAGCSASNQSSSTSGGGSGQVVDGATFTMAIAGDPGALDPATAVNGSTNLLLSFAYDTLVHTDRNNKLVSGLATKWDVTPTSVTFTLAKGATCSDGSPVTAGDVAKSINRVVDPNTHSPLLGVLIPPDVSAKGDDGAHTVTLTTKTPSPFLLQSTAAIFIVCGKGLSDQSVLAKQTSGSGPFQLVEATPNDHYTLKARPGYTWGPGGSKTSDKGVPAKVVLKIVSNESTAANLLLAGDINAASFLGPDRERVENAPGVIKYIDPAGNDDLFFNQAPGRPGADPAVRKALWQAVDLTKLAKVTQQGHGNKSTGLTTLSPRPCQVDSVTGHLPTFDVAAAKQELDAAGWTVGAGGIRAKDGKKLALTILYNSDYGQGYQAGAEFLGSAWKQVGVATTLKATATAAYSDALFKTGDWDVSDVPLGLSLPSQFVGYVSGAPVPEGSNFAHIDNSDYVDLAKKAATTPVADGGCKVWAQAESALFDARDIVPLDEPTALTASKGAKIVLVGGFAYPTQFQMLKG